MFWQRRRSLEDCSNFISKESLSRGHRERHPLYWLDTLYQDVRFAFRLIGRNRWISITIVAAMTIGIALNVSVFTLLNGLFLRPWVRSDPKTFISVIPRYFGKYDLHFSDYAAMPQPDYKRYRDSAKSLESLAAYRLLELTLNGAESGSIRGALVSCNLADVIRPGMPIRGRYLAADECAEPMRQPVAVLSETIWRTRYEADDHIVGRVISLNRIPFTVVGVAPDLALPGDPEKRCDLWVPYTMLGSLNPAEDYFTDPRAQWLTVVGRRKLDYTSQQVQQELASLARLADQEVPGRVTSLMVTNGSLVQDPETGGKLPLIFAISLGTTTLLLLLACINVTMLLLSRSTTRQHEIAVRLSLGAGRGRILRQLLTESLIMSGLATVFSFLIALSSPAALWALLMSSPAPFDLSPDWRVWLYCLCVAVATGIIAGLSPALEMLRPKITESLKGSSTATTPGQRKSKLRSLLVATQIALSLLLLVQVGLLTRAQRQFISYEPGFETKQVLNMTLSSVLSGFNPPSSFYEQLQLRVNAVPGVVNTSFASAVPWSGRHSTAVLEIDGMSIPPTSDIRRQDPAQRAVSPEYFGVLNIEMISGRVFRAGELSSNRQVVPAVISEAMARRYWPGLDPVGHHFRTAVIHEVVGVCRDVQSVRYMQDDGPFYYMPYNLQGSKPPFMLIRVSGNTQLVATALRGIIRQLDPQMACTTATLASLIDGYAERLKPFVICVTIAGSLALFLAITGVYGVASLSVSLRIREIGIHMALGAQQRDIVCLILRSGAVPVFGGLIIGIILAAVASIGTKAVLFGFDPRDPLTFTIVSMLMFFAALAAIWIPAHRGARTSLPKILRQN